jgi:hypothetical protein
MYAQLVPSKLQNRIEEFLAWADYECRISFNPNGCIEFHQLEHHYNTFESLQGRLRVSRNSLSLGLRMNGHLPILGTGGVALRTGIVCYPNPELSLKTVPAYRPAGAVERTVRTFLDECTIPQQDAMIQTGVLYQAYLKWEEEMPVSLTAFGTALTRFGIKKIPTGRNVIRAGIRLR